MFNFLHPRPVVDGRPVVVQMVQMVQQKNVTRQDTCTLIVATTTSGASSSAPADALSKGS